MVGKGLPLPLGLLDSLPVTLPEGVGDCRAVPLALAPALEEALGGADWVSVALQHVLAVEEVLGLALALLQEDRVSEALLAALAVPAASVPVGVAKPLADKLPNPEALALEVALPLPLPAALGLAVLPLVWVSVAEVV